MDTGSFRYGIEHECALVHADGTFDHQYVTYGWVAET